MNVGARERKLRRAKVVQGMAECVDPIAVDVRHRARRSHLEVAAGERDADGIAFAQRTGWRHTLLASRNAGHDRREARAAKAGRHQVDGFGLEAAEQQRRRDWPEHRADLRSCRGGKTNRLHVGRTPRKRREARREGRQRSGESLARDRQLETRLVRPAAAGEPRRVLHLRDRRDARDRLLRKLSNRVGDCADQASVDVDRASAHALGDARLREPGALEPRENQIAARALHVSQDADDVDLEVLELRAFEDGAAHTDHAGLDLFHRHERGGGGKGRAEQGSQDGGDS